MYKNRLADGSCNICGRKVARLRSGLSPKVSQRALAERMQLEGVDLDKNAIQRIECGKRFVTDIELRALAAIFKVPAEELLSEECRREGRNRKGGFEQIEAGDFYALCACQKNESCPQPKPRW